MAADALMMKVREGGLPATSTLGEIAHLARAMKAPRIRDSAAALADRARAEGSTHEQYLARVLDEEVLARETSGSRQRVKAARLPAIKTLVLHLAQLDFLLVAKNVIFLGPPGTGRRAATGRRSRSRYRSATTSSIADRAQRSIPGGGAELWARSDASRLGKSPDRVDRRVVRWVDEVDAS